MGLEAYFTTDEMKNVERNFLTNYGVIRRTALGILTKSGKEFLDLITDNRDFAVALVDVYDLLPEYVQKLTEFIELMEHVNARMLMAYANRPDMEEVFEEGRIQQD